MKNRRKPNKALDKFVEENAYKYTCKELVNILKKELNEEMTLKQVQQYCWRHNINYKKECANKARDMKPLPLGTERVKPDGMVQIKVAFPNKWVYKQRKIYEDYYNVKLPDDVYVIFLDGNRNNFDIKNLKAVNRRYCSGIANYRKERTKEDTEILLLISKLNYRIKNIKKENKI